MKINLKYLPANDKVFGIMFEDRELYTILLRSIFGEDIVLLEDPRTQAQQTPDAQLNNVRFDTIVKTNKGLYSVDMQRSIGTLKRFQNRTVYYACRLTGYQEVTKMKYEELSPVSVTFVMQEDEDAKSDGIRYISLFWEDTREPFGNLMRIAMVYVPTVLKNFDSNSEIYVFADFFAIKTPEQADKFERDFGKTQLGERLMKDYARSICDVDYLKEIEKSEHYVAKEYEELLKEEREILKEERQEHEEFRTMTARSLYEMEMPIDKISKVTKFSVEELKQILNIS